MSKPVMNPDQEQQERDSWIPCYDDMPPEGEVVLTIQDGCVVDNFIPFSNAVGITENMRGKWMTAHYYTTHWRRKPIIPFIQTSECQWCDETLIFNGTKGEIVHCSTGRRECEHGWLNDRKATPRNGSKQEFGGVVLEKKAEVN